MSNQQFKKKRMENEIPLGYKFCPSNSELVLYFLKKKILGQLPPEDTLPIVDVYSKCPDELPFCDLRPGMPHEWYFCTVRSDCKLVTDDGYYSVSMEEEIFKGNQVIGFLRILTYYEGRPPKGRRTSWIIHEFRVNLDIIPIRKLDDNLRAKISNFVACKVVNTEYDNENIC